MEPSGARRSDFYLELMRDSRGLDPARSEARERWFAGLDVSDKEESLFQLEMLMKGLVCFADPTNQPGPREREPVVSRQYAEELRIVRSGCERVAELCRHLLREEEDSGLFAQPLRRAHRDHLRERLLREPVEQDSPEASLRLLASTFSDLSVLSEALSRPGEVSFQVFGSLGRLVGREIDRNVFFDPLVQLEFRPELDRITSQQLLDLVYEARPLGGKRAVTLSCLALLRMIRYLDAALGLLNEPASARLVYLPLAAARSDGRALTRFLARDAKVWLSDGFEQDIMSIRARELPEELPRLQADYELLRRLGAEVHTLGDRLQLELRRTFERELGPLGNPGASEEAARRTETAVVGLLGFLKECVVGLARLFDRSASGDRLFEAYPSAGEETARLRRDAWMFSQILRGFLAKAEAAPAAVSSWTTGASYRFVQEFISYYRNFGWRVAKRLGYEREGRLELLTTCVLESEVDLVERLDELVTECRLAQEFLLATVERLGERPELAGLELDRREAAETLRLYLDR